MVWADLNVDGKVTVEKEEFIMPVIAEVVVTTVRVVGIGKRVSRDR